MKKRNVYLENKPIEEIERLIKDVILDLSLKDKFEELDIRDCFGRVLFEPVKSLVNVPSFLSSAMDGVVIKSKLTQSATEKNLVNISKCDFEEIDTGDLIKEEFDCVIPVEEINYEADGSITVKKAYSPWDNIRQIGDDISYLDQIASKYDEVNEYLWPTLINGGLKTLKVFKKLSVGFIPTGDEIVSPFGDVDKSGKILDCNSYLVKSKIEKFSMDCTIYPIIIDDKKLLKAGLDKAIEENDIVIINGGSSKGRDDYSVNIIKEEGEVIFHGINLKPGKPTILGVVKGKAVIGLPGFSVAASFSLDLIMGIFQKELLRKHNENREIKGILSENVNSFFGTNEKIRVNICKVKDSIKIIPLKRGSSNLFSLCKGDGILSIPPLSQGIKRGTEVSVIPYNTKYNFDHRKTFIGSHDFSIDLLNNILIERQWDYSLISSPKGSFQGLYSLRDGNCDFTGIHILDVGTQTYNREVVQEELGEGYTILKLLKRSQGIIQRRDNIKLKSKEDIGKSQYSLINRQLGSGTRILTDYYIDKNKESREEIRGYETVVFTHLDLCQKIKSSLYDYGIGVEYGAHIYDLDFIKLNDEEYDLVYENSFKETPFYTLLMESIHSLEFKNQIESLKGYTLNTLEEVEV